MEVSKPCDILEHNRPWFICCINPYDTFGINRDTFGSLIVEGYRIGNERGAKCLRRAYPGSGPGSGERERLQDSEGGGSIFSFGQLRKQEINLSEYIANCTSKEYGDYYAREFTFSCSSPDSFLSSRPQRMQERYASGIASTGSGLPCNTTCGCSGERAGDRCGPGGWIRNRSSGGARCPEGCEPEAGRSSLT